jgi:serine/threonine protein kinase
MFFKWFKQTLNGIHFLHNKSIVHRDIKSLNLLITHDYNVKVADFGLARYFNNEQNNSTLFRFRGTYCYAAPELFKQISQFTTKSDIYSLGIVLWELAYRCVVGKYCCQFSEYPLIRPFNILIKAARHNLRPTIPSDVPREITGLITALWDPDPEIRPGIVEISMRIENFEKGFTGELDDTSTVEDMNLPALPPITTIQPDEILKPNEELILKPVIIQDESQNVLPVCDLCIEDSNKKRKGKSVAYEPKLLRELNTQKTVNAHSKTRSILPRTSKAKKRDFLFFKV